MSALLSICVTWGATKNAKERPEYGLRMLSCDSNVHLGLRN
jgi:hypothetical protein